jgi:polysaccharide export outer membrane protein
VIVTREPRWGPIEGPHARIDPDTGYSSVTIPIDLLMSGKDTTNNLVIAPNDLITVPKAELVYVVGDVHKAGGFPVTTHDSVSLLQAISLAEGFGPDSSPKHAHILRVVADGNGTPRDIPIDISKILAGKAPDTKLIANDVLYVPHSGVKVTARRAIEVAIGVGSGVLIYR